MKRIAFVVHSLAVVLVVLASGSPLAQTYPSRPVRMILPYPPGGTSDPPARILAAALSQRSGQQFLVDNRAGASGIIGTEAVAKSKPDGYTLLLLVASHAVTQVLFQYQNKDQPFDMLSSFEHVAIFGISSTVIVANPKVPARNMKELVELLKQHPASLTYGSPGNGTTSHLLMEIVKQQLGVDITHVPYKAATGAMIDLLSGQIDLTNGGVSVAAPYVKSGKLKALAVTTAERSPLLPDVPTVSETYPAFEPRSGYSGVSAPAKTPKEIIAKLEEMIKEAVQNARTREALLAVASEPVFIGSRDTTSRIKSELSGFAKVVRDAKLAID